MDFTTIAQLLVVGAVIGALIVIVWLVVSVLYQEVK